MRDTRRNMGGTGTMNMKNKINLAVMAHVDAGKTTVTEEFLYHSGAKKTLGNVDKGTTTTDSLSLEKERGITIRSSTVSFDWNGIKINLIDTPGHMDFIAEVERTFSVLDGVVLVISAKEGVQPQTRTLFARLKKMNLPIILFLNKIDRIGVNLDEIRKQIEQELTKDCIYLQEVYENDTYELKIKEHTLEEEFITSQLMMYSDKLYEAHFQESGLMHADVCKEELYQAVQESRAYPVYYGSALKNVGIEALLDGIVNWFRPAVNPCWISVLNENFSRQEQLERLTQELSAYVYKIEWLGKNHRKVYVRLYSGALWFKQRVPVYGTDSTLTVNMYCALEHGKEVKADFITPGDICVMYGANALKCGQWLGKPTTRKGLNQELNPLLSVQVAFVDMEYNSVSSTPADYRTLASMVVRRALDLADVYKIQPYMNYEARVPLGFEKYITAKLCEIQAVIMTSEFTQSEAIYRGEVALEDVKDFAVDIKMYTEGKGSFELEFLEYR